MMRAFQKLKRKHKKHKNTNGCNNTTIRFYYFKNIKNQIKISSFSSSYYYYYNLN